MQLKHEALKRRRLQEGEGLVDGGQRLRTKGQGQGREPHPSFWQEQQLKGRPWRGEELQGQLKGEEQEMRRPWGWQGRKPEPGYSGLVSIPYFSHRPSLRWPSSLAHHNQ